MESYRVKIDQFTVLVEAIRDCFKKIANVLWFVVSAAAAISLIIAIVRVDFSGKLVSDSVPDLSYRILRLLK